MAISHIVTYVTKDYGIFKSIQGNRLVSKHNVHSIIKNIKENGLKPTIVIVNENMEVIDGQHRIEALKQLNLPVYYQIHKGLTLSDCVAMNTSVKTWTINDYVSSYAELGNDEYKNLISLRESFPMFTYANIIVVLMDKTLAGSGKILKQGRAKLSYSYPECIARLNDLKECLECCTNLSGRREIAITVIARLLKLDVIDNKRFKEQLDKYGYLLNNLVDIHGCLEKLEEIYNYRKANRVRFISKYYEIYEDNLKEEE